MRIALLTAAVNADNAGDAFIESAIRRMVVADHFERYPLVTALSDEQIASINRCDMAIICGTNLYQHQFVCNLDVQTINRIAIPILPLGIGSSCPVDQLPKMRDRDIEAVKALHERCGCSSVRDRSSLHFLHSIGVKNAVLTGCPVFFHALRQPDFDGSGEGLTITPRARLLHIDPQWESRQHQTLRTLCRRYQPTLVLQSPYDRGLAQELSAAYGCDVFEDPQWQADRYIERVRRQEATIGFRLHYAMLSMSYGKPAWVIGHDSRVAGFHDLVGLPRLDIRSYADSTLLMQLEGRDFDGEQVRSAWRNLALVMRQFIEDQGLACRLSTESVSETARPVTKWDRQAPPGGILPDRPIRLLMLVDKPNWAFDHSARQIALRLWPEFHCDIRYVRQAPPLDPSDYDLAYVFFWGEDYHRRFGFDPERVVMELSSHRWEDDPRYGPCAADQMVERYLRDAAAVLCTSERLQGAVVDHHPSVYHTPNGVDSSVFRPTRERTGPMVIGWAGAADDPVKGLHDILHPACEGRFNLEIAPGNVSHVRMNRFYNRCDVFAVTSRHEGEPLTLIEAMAAGCFPVCSDVGIARELIHHQENGLIVPERTPQAFDAAFRWCADHLEKVRAAGRANATTIRRERDWSVTVQSFRRAFIETLARANQPRFRNDDVSWDTPLDQFKAFCDIFRAHRLTQIHGVTLFGQTAAIYRYGDAPCEYEGFADLSRLPNKKIRELAAHQPLADREDLLAYLRHSPDEVALHGLFHTDFSAMSAEEHRHDIEMGLELLTQLLPNKTVRYFIPPFNRVSDMTAEICASFGLKILGTEGVHLEDALPQLSIQPGTWYRYHHHRFYPESAFTYYDLSLEKLDAALSRSTTGQPVALGLQPQSRPSRVKYRMGAMWRRLRNAA